MKILANSGKLVKVSNDAWQVLSLDHKNSCFLHQNLHKNVQEIMPVKLYFKKIFNRNLNIFCLVYLLIFSLVLVLSSICYCSKIIFFSEYFPNSESDFVHFRSLFLQESRDPSPKFISKGSNLQTYILLKRFLCTTDREVSIEPTWKSAVSYRHQLYQLMAL